MILSILLIWSFISIFYVESGFNFLTNRIISIPKIICFIILLGPVFWVLVVLAIIFGGLIWLLEVVWTRYFKNSIDKFQQAWVNWWIK